MDSSFCVRPLGSSANLTPSKFAAPSKNAGKVDRFIPSRSASSLESFSLDVSSSLDSAGSVSSSPSSEFRRQLAASLGQEAGARVLAFKRKAPAAPAGHECGLGALEAASARPAPRRAARALPSGPERVLDAPDLLDDYYLNLLDWGSSDVLAVGLGPSVYLWNAKTGGIDELLTASDGAYISSVAWAADGRHVAVGTSDACVQVWDAERGRPVRRLEGRHQARVGALAWSGHTLSTGGRDGLIANHDVRVRASCRAELRGHSQEVAGLRWSPSGAQLASGGNDNLTLVWDAASTSASAPAQRLTAHRAAVKALAWCPFQANLLATGGGSADGHIRFWNTLTGAQVNAIDTGAQVCALQWNPHDREILSSHGFAHNRLCLWRYPTLAKVGELEGHQSRVLHLATSPDGTTVASAAADETLRFWRVFDDVRTNGTASASRKDAVDGLRAKTGLARSGLVR